MLARDPNSLLYYDDAVSHLVIARRIIDSLTPGIAQFGSVWLPMTHLLLLPFTISNYLFQTGLAGTIVSGISTAIAAVFLSRIVKLHFSSNYAGYLAASLFLMNTSVIYIDRKSTRLNSSHRTISYAVFCLKKKKKHKNKINK